MGFCGNCRRKHSDVSGSAFSRTGCIKSCPNGNWQTDRNEVRIIEDYCISLCDAYRVESTCVSEESSLSLSLSLSLRTWKQEALTKNLKSHKILLRLAKERDNFWLTEISFATPLAQILCFFEDTHSAWHVVYKLRNLTLEYCRHLISCARNRVDGCELDPCRMMDSSERANGIVSTQYVRRNKFGIPATCFAQSGPALEETRTI